eukprot:5986375-Pyramimonas_sp.AAC.1
MAPPSLDIQNVRIKRWQRAARETDQHAQLLACGFGKLLCEPTTTLDFAWAPVHTASTDNARGSSDGNGPTHMANPWRK